MTYPSYPTMNSDNLPLVSVLLPVYNAEAYLPAALRSIFQQTYPNLEVIIVDDGSKDKSIELIRPYLAYKNIKLIENIENKGVVASLNLGLRFATGKYIARMDADDIAFHKRMAKQVAYLESHPNCLLVGTAMLEFNANRITRYWLSPKDQKKLNIKKLFNAPFAHPTTMIRREVFERLNGYTFEYPVIEDYKLWLEIMEMGATANLQVPLLFYRKHEQNESIKRKSTQKASLIKLYFEEWTKQGIAISEQEAEQHYRLCTAQIEDSFDLQDLDALQRWAIKLLAWNQAHHTEQKFYFRFYLGALLVRCFLAYFRRLSWRLLLHLNLTQLWFKLPLLAIFVWGAMLFPMQAIVMTWRYRSKLIHNS